MTSGSILQVENAYECTNGLIGLNRDVVMKLIKIVGRNEMGNKKIKNVQFIFFYFCFILCIGWFGYVSKQLVGMGNEIHVWKTQKIFKWARLGLFISSYIIYSLISLLLCLYVCLHVYLFVYANSSHQTAYITHDTPAMTLSILFCYVSSIYFVSCTYSFYLIYFISFILYYYVHFILF